MYVTLWTEVHYLVCIPVLIERNEFNTLIPYDEIRRYEIRFTHTSLILIRFQDGRSLTSWGGSIYILQCIPSKYETENHYQYNPHPLSEGI